MHNNKPDGLAFGLKKNTKLSWDYDSKGTEAGLFYSYIIYAETSGPVLKGQGYYSIEINKAVSV